MPSYLPYVTHCNNPVYQTYDHRNNKNPDNETCVVFLTFFARLFDFDLLFGKVIMNILFDVAHNVIKFTF